MNPNRVEVKQQKVWDFTISEEEMEGIDILSLNDPKNILWNWNRSLKKARFKIQIIEWDPLDVATEEVLE